MNNFKWDGDDEMLKRIQQYGDAVEGVAMEVAQYFAPQIEAAAKQDAAWTDRTGNARQGLFTTIRKNGKSVSLYLSHAMDYGMWLELRHHGRYAIIMRTLSSFYPKIQRMFKGTFGQ